ncbi:MAG: hypothetical protein RSA99_02965, partial [Oscillospiraceae bacterium]
ITYICGHEGQIELFGKNSEREKKQAYQESFLCTECYAKKMAERAKETAEKDEKDGLSKLTGTEKQIAWATDIRRTKIEELNKTGEKVIEAKKEEYNQFVKWCSNQSKSTFFIEIRDMTAMQILSKYLPIYSAEIENK